ncbi:MAG: hypothetical protein R6X16_01035 [Anaerolineae bacterium]
MRPDQRRIADALQVWFGDVPVLLEWVALRGDASVYSPHVDIAVGPFAVEEMRLEGRYDELVEEHLGLLAVLHAFGEENVRSLVANDVVADLNAACMSNRNARCFIAIEMEGSGSRKHTLGGILNAAALGRIGVSVACSAEELRKLLRLRRYLRFLMNVEKNTYDTANLIVVTREQLASAIGVDLEGIAAARPEGLSKKRSRGADLGGTLHEE